MNDTLVAINLTADGKLLNKTNVPILYYWNGEAESIMSSIKTDETFKSYIVQRVIVRGEYDTAEMSYFYYDNEEKYVEHTAKINKMWIFADFNSDELHNYVCETYIKEVFNSLYKGVFKEDYQFIDDWNINLQGIYNTIKEKYPERVEKDTVINYLRSQIQDKLSAKNWEYIENYVTNIL